jgi:hypothetical protein
MVRAARTIRGMVRATRLMNRVNDLGMTIFIGSELVQVKI